MNAENLIDKFNNINPNDDSLYEVDSIIELLYELDAAEAKKVIESMFKIFERLNNGHYDSVLWSILHAIEDFEAYEDELIKSVKRKPNEFNILMINRVLNIGEKEYKSTNYLSLLNDAGNHENLSPDLKEKIKEYINKHSL